MRQLLRRYSPKLKFAVVFFFAIACLIAQDATSFVNPNVARVGEKLACRCGGCRNSVASCPMMRCEYSDPMRRRIAQMQGQGMSDSAIIASIVKEEGVAALTSPPAVGWGLFTWVMPAIALLLGFFVYSRWVKRNKQQPAPLSEGDRAMIERFRAQIDREFGDEEKEPSK